jgi:transposase InsO family protein
MVSRAGFYAWCRRPASTRVKRDRKLRRHVVAFHLKSKRRYGSRPIVRDLRDIGEFVSRRRVVRLMREAKMHGKTRRAFKLTTNSAHRQPVAENVLDRRFAPVEIQAPNRVWASDITYLRTREGWLYLAVVLDLFSRRVIGWSMSHRLESRLVLDALTMAAARRGIDGAVLVHSDRGVQYASDAVQRFYHRHGMICSMSRKGNCWDNAVTESFFATLKRELDDQIFNSREMARTAIFEFIEIWYNRQRRHSTLGYVSPEQFEKTQAA